jgi:hypothetical protein
MEHYRAKMMGLIPVRYVFHSECGQNAVYDMVMKRCIICHTEKRSIDCE